MRNALFAVLKVAISVVLLAALIWNVGPDRVAGIAAEADYRYLAAAILLWFGSVVFSVQKWNVMLHAQGIRLPYRLLLTHYYIGLFFNNFLPIVGQDVVRGYGLARDAAQAHEIAIAVLVDRMVGLLSFIVNGALMSVVIVTVFGRRDLMPFSIATCTVAAGVVLVFASVFSRRLRHLIEWAFHGRFLNVLLPTVVRLSEALVPYRRNARVLFIGYGLATASMVVTHLVNWFVSLAVHAGVGLEYIFLFNALVVFAPLLIPSMGGLGVNQGAFVYLYATLGQTTSVGHAFAMGLMMQVVTAISSAPGAVLWWRGHTARAAARPA